MTHLEDDVAALMKKRVFELAGCLGKSVKVELNGTWVPVKSFTDYVNLYLDSAAKSKPEKLPSYHVKVNDRWEICVSLSDGQFQQVPRSFEAKGIMSQLTLQLCETSMVFLFFNQVNFVNSNATTKDGTHVDYITNQITNHTMNFVNKKNKNANIKPIT